MKLVFCGTPAFALPTLEALIAAGHEISLVVSQPDRPVGRAQTPTAPPVKQAALAAGLPVTQPEKIRNNLEFLFQFFQSHTVALSLWRRLTGSVETCGMAECVTLHGECLCGTANGKMSGAQFCRWN